MKSYLFMMLLFSKCIAGLAQVPEIDFIKINEAYLKAGTVWFNTKYSIFQGDNTTPAFSERGEIYINRSFKYFKSQGVEIIENDTLRLLANHREMRISIMPVSLSEKRQSALSFIDSSILTEAVRTAKSIKYERLGSNRASYIVLMENNTFNYLKIVFNSKTYLVERMELTNTEQEEKTTLVVECTNIKVNPKLDESTYSLNYFLNINDKSIATTPRYKDYRLSNLFSRKKINK